MAEAVDGSIIIDTELNSDGFAAGSKELLSATRSLGQQVKQLGASLQEMFAKTYTANIDLGGAGQKASGLRREIDGVSSAVQQLEPTYRQAMRGSESASERLQYKAASLQERISTLQQELARVGQTRYPTQEYETLSAELEKAEQKLETLIDKQQKLRALSVNTDSQQWKSLQFELDKTAQSCDRLSAAKERMESSGTAFRMGADTEQYRQLEAALSAASSRLGEMQAGLGESNGLMHSLASGAGKAAGFIGRMAGAAAGALASGIRSAASHMLGLLGHSRSTKNQFGGLISSARRFTLSLLGARGVYTLLRRAVSAFMAENQQLSSTLSACWSGIGNLLGPIITRLINLVAQAVSYVTSFLKLFGLFSNSATSAIGSAGSAASGAVKDLKRQLASFDELNVLSDNSSGGGGSGGGGSASAGLTDIDLPDWAKLLVEQLKAGEWGKAAATLADKLNEMVESVDWDGIGNKIGKSVDGALTFVATFIKKFDWKNVGRKLAQMLNNVITGVDWGNLGAILAAKWAILLQLLSGFFEKLDGRAISNGLVSLIRGAINAVNWKECLGGLSRNISNFIKQINFGDLAETLSDGFTTVLGALNAAITEFDWDGLGSQIADFINNIKWEDVITEIMNLHDNITNGVTDFLCRLVENTNWGDVGSAIGRKLNNLFSNIKWDKIGRTISGAIKGILKFLTQALAEANLGEILQDLLDGLGDLVANLDTAGILKGIVGLLTNIITQVPNIIMGLIGGLISAISGTLKSIKKDNFISEWLDGIADDIRQGSKTWSEVIRKPVADWVNENLFDSTVEIETHKSTSGASHAGGGRTFGGGTAEDDHIGTLTKDIQDLGAAWDSTMQRISANSLQSTGELDYLSRLKDELSEYIDDNGNLLYGCYEPRVKFILGELNGALGTEYQLIDGQIRKYGDLKAEIDKLIETERIQIALAAEKEAYSTAIQNMSLYQSKLSEAQLEYDRVNEKIKDARRNGQTVSKEMLDERIAAQAALNEAQGLVGNAAHAIAQYETDLTLSMSENEEDRKQILDRQGQYCVENGKVIELSLQDQLNNEQNYLQTLERLHREGDETITSEMIAAQQKRVDALRDKCDESVNTTQSEYTDIKKTVDTQGTAVVNTAEQKWKRMTDDYRAQIGKLPADTKTAVQGAAKALGTNEVPNAAANTGKNAKNAFSKELDMKSAADDAVRGIEKGIDEGAYRVVEAMKRLAKKTRDAFTNTLEIESPSKVFTALATFIPAGVANGVDKNTKAAVQAVSGMTTAMQSELRAGEFSIGRIDMVSGLTSTLNSFSDTVTASFEHMLDRLRTIAESVHFQVPAIAYSAIPYSARAQAGVTGTDVGSVIETSNDELANVVTQVVANATSSIVSAIQTYSNTTINLDKTALAEMTVRDINRRTRMVGKSPLISR